MLKKGFTLMELMISMVVIGVLLTVGYSQYAKIIDNAKITKVVDELKQAQVALGKAQGVSGINWGGNIDSSGDMTVLNPLEVPEKTSSKYHYRISPKDDGSKATSMNVVATEKELYKVLAEMFPVGAGVFRSKAFPNAQYGFTTSYGGKNMIILSGLPGNIAVGVRKALNGQEDFSDSDGLTVDKPIVITHEEADMAIVNKVLDTNGAITNIITNACIPANKANCGDSDDLVAYVSNRPSVTLYYFYNNSKATW